VRIGTPKRTRKENKDMEVLVILLVVFGAFTQVALVGSVITKGGNDDDIK
jgi:hypothetical protein